MTHALRIGGALFLAIFFGPMALGLIVGLIVFIVQLGGWAVLAAAVVLLLLGASLIHTSDALVFRGAAGIALVLIAVVFGVAYFSVSGLFHAAEYLDYDHTQDMTPLQIRMRVKAEDRGVMLNVPRAYVSLSYRSGYRLPAAFDSNHIQLSFDTEGRAAKFADTPQRAKSTHVELHASRYQRPKKSPAEVLKAPIAMPSESFEGLVPTKHSSSSYLYYPGSAADQFSLAICFSERNADFFCTYYFDAADFVTGEAHFMDFRLHGGRKFANERLRFARSTVCRYLENC